MRENKTFSSTEMRKKERIVQYDATVVFATIVFATFNCATLVVAIFVCATLFFGLSTYLVNNSKQST